MQQHEMTQYGQQQNQQQAPVIVQMVPQQVPSQICCSVVNLLLFCPPLGLIALIFAIQANSERDTGNMASASSKAGTAKTLNIIGIILGILVWIGIAIYLAVFFIFLQSMLSSFGNLAESVSSMDFDDLDTGSLNNGTDMADVSDALDILTP